MWSQNHNVPWFNNMSQNEKKESILTFVVHYHISAYNYHCPHTHTPNNINHLGKWCLNSKLHIKKKLVIQNMIHLQITWIQAKTWNGIHTKSCVKKTKPRINIENLQETTLCVLESQTTKNNLRIHILGLYPKHKIT